MPRDKSEPKKVVRRACDACHHRRVRCNHANPCDNCVRLGIACSWIKASKGKQASGKRIELLRKGHNPAAGEFSSQSLPDIHTGNGSTAPPPPPPMTSAPYGRPPSHPHMSPPQHYSREQLSPKWKKYPDQPGYRDETPHSADVQYSPHQHQRHSSSASSSAGPSRLSVHSLTAPQVPDYPNHRYPATAGVGPSFNPSDNFNQVLGNAFSELSPDVAAGFRLPDFGTSLADTYFNPQQQTEGARRNLLHDMQYFGSSSDGQALSGSNGNGQRQTVLDVLGQSNVANGPGSTPGSTSQSEPSSLDPMFDSNPLSDSVLIPTIALFFERLQSIMPVFTRAWIFNKLDHNDHHSDPQFGSMLIAMSAFALIQPVEASDPVAIHARKKRVKRLLHEAVQLRSGALFGQDPSLEATMTSFFIFGTLFGLGEENAAWFRLREAVTLGYLLRLHEPSAYEQLDKDEQERRLRAYWLLAITERAYAIQSGHSITFRGNPRAATAAIRRKFDVSQLEDFPNLQSRLFDVVDEKFVDCWNKKCPGQGCEYLDAKRAIQLHDAIVSDEDDTDPIPKHASDMRKGSDASRPSGPSGLKQESSRSQSGSYSSSSDWHKAKVQKADVDVTRQWLLNRLWLTCLSHGLLTADNEQACLRIDYAIDIARETLRVCNALSLRSMEAHGIGLTRKLNDIAQTLVVVCREFPAIAMSVPYEGDPINIAPNQFGPHTGPSPSEHHGSPTFMSTSESPAQPGSSSTAGLSQSTPIDPAKAFSPSFAIEAILHKYLDLFKRFRGGDHPYLPQLVEAVKELPKMAELSFDKFLREMGLF